MYFKLGIDYANLNVTVYPESHFSADQSLTRGRLLPENIATPFKFRLEVAKDADGIPEVPVLYAYFPNAAIMEKRLVATLQAAGVDNLQVFPAVVVNHQAGTVIENYLAVNVVGMVSCADMSKSTAKPLADVHFFLKLEIDPGKARDALMFRLAESPMEIIVHEKTAKAIEDGGFTGIVLEPVSP
jgi:Immunity protein family (Imm11)